MFVLLSGVVLDLRALSQIRMPRAQRIGIPTPTPTPSAILDVVVRVVDWGVVLLDDVVAEEDGDDDGEEYDARADDDTDARLRVLPDVEEDIVAVVVVDVGSEMLKYVDVKPSGPSGFIQRKKTLE